MYETPTSDVLMPDYVAKLQNSFREAYNRVREKVGFQQQRQKEIYYKRVHGTQHKTCGFSTLQFEKENPGSPTRQCVYHSIWTRPRAVGLPGFSIHFLSTNHYHDSCFELLSESEEVYIFIANSLAMTPPSVNC